MAGICFSPSELEVEDLNEDFYVFKSRKWPESWLQVPSVGNGHLATVLKYSWMHMSGLFNGNETNSQRARIPSTVAVNLISPAGDQDIEYKLDTRIGTFFEQHKVSGWNITLEWFAHRTILPVLVFQVVATKDETLQNPKPTSECLSTELDSKGVLILELNVSRVMDSEDINLENLTSEFPNVGFYHGRTKIPEHPDLSECQDFYILHDFIPETLEVQRTENIKKWTFITSIHYSKDVVIQAYRQGKDLERFGNLEKDHNAEWLKLWASGRIELPGNLNCSQAAASSLYNILSSIPIQSTNPFSGEDTFHTESYTTLFTGLSPSGLPWGDEESYQGHTFWDAETWMFPAILMLHYELSPTLLHSRVRTMGVAAQNAMVDGLKGLRYPWESALTGLETAPDEKCGQLEIHINGDISMAIMQYMKISPHHENISFPSSYLNILKGIGDFWLSRAEYDDVKGLYEIKDVMPPDEYAEHVNNSAYTNAVAALSLKAASLASIMSGDPKAPIYEEAAAKMYIPFDPNYDYHPEFDGFEMGTEIKQADVVLMGFPLMMDMMHSTRKSDLEIYENVTSVKGPAMSDSMHSIGWLEVGEEKRAHKSFEKMFQHISGDFQIWTEEKGGKGSPNFITGMGGYLQALLFGYGGLRILDDSLQINPFIMEDTSSIEWHGINYRGCSFNLGINEDKIMHITLTLAAEMVEVSFEVHKKDRIPLREGYPLTMNATLGFLRVESKVA